MKYEVTIYGPTGRFEKHDVDADLISVLGAEDSLIVFKKRKKIVFAVRKVSFVSATPASSAAAPSRLKGKSPALRVV